MDALQPAFPTHHQPHSSPRIARLVVPQMSCREATDRIKACIRQLDGVHAVSTSARTHTVTVRFQPRLTGIADMMAAIERAGYSVVDMVQSGAGELARSMQFTVPAMDCDFCADHLSRSLKRLPGVVVVTTDVAAQHVSVRFAPERVEAATIRATVARAGYSLVDAVPPEFEDWPRASNVTLPDRPVA